jgi:hypothetical protein
MDVVRIFGTSKRLAFVGSATRVVGPEVYDQTFGLLSYGELPEVFWEISNRVNYGVSIEDRVADFDFDPACDSEAQLPTSGYM